MLFIINFISIQEFIDGSLSISVHVKCNNIASQNHRHWQKLLKNELRTRNSITAHAFL